MEDVKVSTFRGEMYWTKVKIGDNVALLTPVEVEKLIKELEATIS